MITIRLTGQLVGYTYGCNNINITPSAHDCNTINMTASTYDYNKINTRESAYDYNGINTTLSFDYYEITSWQVHMITIRLKWQQWLL